MDIVAKFTRLRAMFIVSLLAIATLIAIVDWLLIARGPTANAAVIIDKTVAALEIKPRNFELPTEKAARARDAIKRGDYAAARQIFDDVRTRSAIDAWRYDPFDAFITAISDPVDPAFAARLDAWVAQSLDDAVPLLLRAQYGADAGWFRRGHRYAGEVEPDALAAFENYMTKARADVDAAIRLDDSIPYAFYLKLRILQGSGASGDVHDAFERAIARHPTYYPLYDIALLTLEPKWGGTVSQMYAFVDKYAGQAGERSPLKLLYLALYRGLLDASATACNGSRDHQDETSACIAGKMGPWVTRELEKSVVAALALYDHSDKYEFGVAVRAIVTAMLQTTGGDSYAGAILQLAATAMHSDTQLKQEKPGSNDYVIDQLLAQSWFHKGFYDNALAKAHDALKDIDATAFASDAQRDLARAGIYEDIARISTKLRRYADIIGYEKAAVAVGNLTAGEHFICYGYYAAKDYATAIRTCDKAIADQPANLFAYYLRGVAYRDAGRPDEALRDLAVVAGSDSELRAGAAIAMSMIHFGRNDLRGALAVLNRYAYLYDPNKTKRADVAVGYNNRCYAYMELGELKKALDDCTQSLSYGSLPDAFRKQQELVKRLRKT